MNIKTLQQFCNRDRLAIAQPFNQHGHTYATDGRIIIRITPQMECEDFKRPDTPRVDRLELSWRPPHEGAISVPNLGTQMKDEAGKDVRHVRFRVGANFFDVDLLRRLTGLPALKLYPNKSDEGKPMYFSFDGGDGYIMPFAT